MYVREANSDDLPTIYHLIRQLAEYGRLIDEVSFDEEELGRHLFGEQAVANVLIGEIDGTPAGFALYLSKLSTFKGKLVCYLEDLFVVEALRGKGLGTLLLREVAAQALNNGCARLEWAVLDWNKPAIQFYEKLGAEINPDWRTVHLGGRALEGLGSA